MSSFDILEYDEVSSTQDVCKALAQQQKPSRTLVVAKTQTQGRGRKDRRWSSENALLMSLLWRPNCPSERLHFASFLTAAALFESCTTLNSKKEKLYFKWPNDLVVAHQKPGPLGKFRKVAGILLEAQSDAQGRCESLIIGVGVNTQKSTWPTALNDRAARVSVDPTLLRDAFLEAFEKYIGGLNDERVLQKGLNLLREHHSFLGRRVRHEGRALKALDIDSQGALICEDEAQNRIRILAGDVVAL